MALHTGAWSMSQGWSFVHLASVRRLSTASWISAVATICGSLTCMQSKSVLAPVILQSGEAQLQGKLHRLEAALRSRGYEVARGATKLFNIPDCPDMIAAIGSCLGNNPPSPHIVPSVPLWPDEYVDEGLRGLVGPLPNDTWSTHRMDKREAVLVFGLLPPPAKYFGIQTCIFSRPGAPDPNDPISQATQSDPVMHGALFSTLPTNPARVMVFASMGNSNNNATIANQAGSAFNQQGAFLISTDAALTREMTNALVNARVTERNRVFAEPVSSSSVNRLAVLEGVANVPDNVLRGSASGFGGVVVVADADKFYIQYFVRNCNGIAHCLTITEDMVPKGTRSRSFSATMSSRVPRAGPIPRRYYIRSPLF